MKQSTVFSCEKCGKPFSDEGKAQEHEKKCLPLEVGQRVKFLFELFSVEGRITGLGQCGDEPTVDLETDMEITDVDHLHDGKHVWVTRDNVLSVI